VWCMLFLVLTILSVGALRKLDALSSFLGVAGLVLVTVGAIQITSHLIQPGRRQTSTWGDFVASSCRGSDALHPRDKSNLPDIYYLIFDRYARADVLRADYGLDTTTFLQHLRKQGFYVASKTNSNYGHSHISLASSLNMDYLDRLARSAGVRTITSSTLQDMIRDSRVIRLLKGAGYKIVFFPSDYHFLQLSNPDIVIQKGGISLTQFDRALLDMTMLRIVKCGLGGYKGNIEYALDHLCDVPKIKAPTITFAHIAVTHDPYVFDAHGNMPDAPFDQIVSPNKDTFSRLYPGSIVFANKTIERIVKNIIAGSATPPIIILQADHGENFEFRGEPKPDPERKTRILNAYYLPEDGEKVLYPSITPVNTFRVIFNKYFGTHHKLLDDTVYDAFSKGGGMAFRRVSR